MVRTDTNCQNCAHLKACSITDDVEEAKNKIMNNFEDVGQA